MLVLAFLALAAVLAVVYVRFAGAVIWKGLLAFAVIFAALNVLYILFYVVMSLFLDVSKPITRQNRLCRTAIVSVTGMLLTYCGVRVHLSGLEKLPGKGRYVFICNHRSAFDPLITLNKLNCCDLGFISKPSNMALPVVGPVAHNAGCLAIDRENDRNALKTILTAVNYLKNDICSIGIYPEGTRSHSDELLEFHAGSFKIAQKANVPIVVASIRGSERVPKNVLRRKTDVYLDILEVIDANEVKQTHTHELSDRCKGVIEQHLRAVSA